MLLFFVIVTEFVSFQIGQATVRLGATYYLTVLLDRIQPCAFPWIEKVKVNITLKTQTVLKLEKERKIVKITQIFLYEYPSYNMIW